MTAHTFQGQSAGQVDKEQPKNAVDRIVFDPGNKQFEGNNPGTLYMGASRATTAGTGNRDSALYFSGQNMNTFRVINLRLQRDGKTPSIQKSTAKRQMGEEARRKHNHPEMDRKSKERTKGMGEDI